MVVAEIMLIRNEKNLYDFLNHSKKLLWNIFHNMIIDWV
jgi:hypothetical protein